MSIASSYLSIENSPKTILPLFYIIFRHQTVGIERAIEAKRPSRRSEPIPVHGTVQLSIGQKSYDDFVELVVHWHGVIPPAAPAKLDSPAPVGIEWGTGFHGSCEEVETELDVKMPVA